MFNRSRRQVRDYGLRDMVESKIVDITKVLLPSGYHKASIPSLFMLFQASQGMYVTARELVTAHLSKLADGPQWSEIQEEHDELQAQLRVRYDDGRTLRHPRHFGVEDETSLLLYAVVRMLRPATVVETGAANGHSAFFILNGMARNDHGTLHSIDVSEDVGGLLEDAERSRWRPHVIDRRDAKHGFERVLDGLPLIDFFIHDSDHSYRCQRYEYERAYRQMSPKSILASDDAEWSFASLDFCRALGARPVFLTEPRKVFGLLAIRDGS